jgi:hypothetical protein
MNLFKAFKSNRGTALIMVILIIIVMSVLGLTLMMATYSGLLSGIFYSDGNKAYFAAEAAAEEVALELDERVATRQENARTKASDYVKELFREEPDLIKEKDGSIKQSVLDSMFRTKYLEYFYAGLQEEFGNLDTEFLKGLLNTANAIDGKPYKDINEHRERMILESAYYDSDNHRLNIIVSGVFADIKKKLEVSFNLLPDPEKIPFVPIKSSVLNSGQTMPTIFRKALVAEKNIIAAGGKVNISGDVLCFGTVPADENGEEDQESPWYRYGGIMAGVSEQIADNSGEFGFDPRKTGVYKGGSFLINGNAATMAYVHSIYGTQQKPSNITITGKTFARSVRSEENSNYSFIELINDVYTTGNLQIDSDATTVNVRGKYYGFVDAGYAIDGSGAGTSEKDLKDVPQFKNTGSIEINGDSYLNMNNEIYLGGSTLFKNINDTGGFPYISGISALKADKQIADAFKRNNVANPDNILYWYNKGKYDNPNPVPYFKKYTQSGSYVDMLAGKADNPDYFPMGNRAMHFKGVWENLWKNNSVFSGYLSTGNIRISGDGIDWTGKLKGYSNGAVIANGKVFGIDEFEGGHDPVVFRTVQKKCTQDFYNAVSDFFIESYSPEAPRLNQVKPTKPLSFYKDNGNLYIGVQKIPVNEPYPVPGAGVFFYGNQDTEITSKGGKWYIAGKEMPATKGIIFVEGNIYIGAGFNFNGILMASKNIVFLGDSNINYDASVENLIKSDSNISGFFKLLSYETPDETLKSQRIQVENLTIEKWNEIPAY